MPIREELAQTADDLAAGMCEQENLASIPVSWSGGVVSLL
jgi:hypothetical protein